MRYRLFIAIFSGVITPAQVYADATSASAVLPSVLWGGIFLSFYFLLTEVMLVECHGPCAVPQSCSSPKCSGPLAQRGCQAAVGLGRLKALSKVLFGASSDL